MTRRDFLRFCIVSGALLSIGSSLRQSSAITEKEVFILGYDHDKQITTNRANEILKAKIEQNKSQGFEVNVLFELADTPYVKTALAEFHQNKITSEQLVVSALPSDLDSETVLSKLRRVNALRTYEIAKLADKLWAGDISYTKEALIRFSIFQYAYGLLQKRCEGECYQELESLVKPHNVTPEDAAKIFYNDIYPKRIKNGDEAMAGQAIDILNNSKAPKTFVILLCGAGHFQGVAKIIQNHSPNINLDGRMITVEQAANRLYDDKALPFYLALQEINPNKNQNLI